MTSWRFFLFPALVLPLVSIESSGGIPALATSTVPDRITLSPGPRIPGNPIGGYTVVVNDAFGAPCAGAGVSIVFSPGADGLIAWCVGQPHPALPMAFTDVFGTVTIDILGGGCIHPNPWPGLTTQACASAPPGPPAATVTIFDPGGAPVFG